MCGWTCCARARTVPAVPTRAKPHTGRSRWRRKRGCGAPRTRCGPTRRPMTRCKGSPAIMPFTRAASTRSPSSERLMVPTQNWEVRKPGAVSARGLVAAQNGAAAEIGAEILAAGGSAVDAVIATAFALAVLEPWNSGLGGIGFMVVHPAGAAQAETIDFGPVAPQGLDPAAYPLTGATHTQLFTWPQVKDDRNVHGPLSFTIPSAVRGYAAAAALARVGLPVDWYTTLKVATAAVDLRRYDESRRIWLPDGLPPVAPPEEDRF